MNDRRISFIIVSSPLHPGLHKFPATIAIYRMLFTRYIISQAPTLNKLHSRVETNPLR